LIAGGWFAPASAAYLGAANLAGYTAGALLAPALASRWTAVSIVRAMMALATVAFFACAVPLSFAWFFVWRLASGVAGGSLMVLAAPTVLPHVSPARRGLAGGVIFTGVGLGIGASGTLVPLLLRWGLTQAWCGLGVLALIFSAVGWTGWPREAPGSRTAARPDRPPRLRSSVSLKAIYVEYGLNAIGLVPHMVFLVDFVARGLGRGLDIGGRYWVLFGVGAILGPVLAGRAADRIGFRSALRWALALQAAAVAVLAIWTSTGWLIASSLLIGAFVPGVVPLVLGRVQELAPPEARTAAWGRATTAFAVGLTAAGYAFSFLYARTTSYTVLFALGGALIALALAIDLAVRPLVGGDPPTGAAAPAPPRPAAR
jgi:predicted MFS family arabinose efflux permease